MTKKHIGFVLAIFLVSCGESDKSSTLRAIIGDNNLQPYLDPDELSLAIGKTVVGCTVAHLGNGLVLTAGHCVPSNYCESNSNIVTWGYLANNPAGILRSRCVDVVSRNFGDESDYALLQYEAYPEAAIPVNIDDKPSEGEALNILSHPDGKPLQNSGWCWHLGDYEGKRFKYDCDTSRGSSGAPIFNESLEIVGIHNLSREAQGFNAGTYLIDIVDQ